ncbi:glycosyltransferase [Neobacillus notoginsengisoli]|uniref:Glycosyltransferase n=1 Tax=Neobacillus notoginsengisoli TaxID=1578198 RepID=A0A417YR81_9BACI|nr:glycosyltransferase [Neobacillus notoginsengisoli]RHW37246.1 glycosyltransferase [Neobacillus notoginsengisoli]
MSRKKVCMFVWNHFTNDARVLRECAALSESEYSVDLICIHDPAAKNMAKMEKRNEHFHVYRVRRYPLMLDLIQMVIKSVKKDKWKAIFYLLGWGVLAYLWPIFTIFITLLLGAIYKLKLIPWWVKANIYIRMVARARLKKYDIYHSNDLNTLIQGYVSAKWRFKKKKLVYDSHEVQTSRTGYNSPVYGKLESFLVKKIDTMIVENDTRAKFNEELYGFYPNVVHNYPFKHIGEGTEVISIHQMFNLPKDEKILLYQGGIQVGRGLEKLIKAVPLFKKGTLVLVGDGKQKPELVKMVEAMNLHNRVKFIPKALLEDLPKFTRNAYLGFQVLNNVCFNHWSASSNKLFEYMMSGVPVVACSFPEIKRVVVEEQVGICVDSHDYKDIARAVNILLEDEELRNQYSRNCLTAKEKYNWEQEKKVFLSIYDQII